MAAYTGELIYVPMWNHFDEWGLTLALPRIDDETIPSYRSRLTDVIKHRAGPGHLGLFYGINRDFGLSVWHNALTIQTAKNAEGQSICPDLMVEVRANGIAFSTEAFRVIREAEIVPTDTLRVKLTYKAVSRNIILEYPLGTKVDPEAWTFDWERNEIVFKDGDYAGLTITVSYLYYEIVPTYGQTLAQVVTAINSITTPGGDSVAVATANIDDTLSAEGIPLLPAEFVQDIHTTPTGEYYDEYRLPLGQASLRALNDEDFINTVMGTGDVYFDTPLIRWVEQAMNVAGIGWESIQFDESRLSEQYGLAVIPTLADPKTTLWRSSDPSQSTTYSAYEADYYGFTTGEYPLRRFGFAQTEMQSGVGGRDDLKVIIEEGDETVQFTPTTYDFFTMPTGDPAYSGDPYQMTQEGF